MKKSLLALAVLGAFAGVASAQSSVTLYGTIDVNLRYVKNTGQDKRLSMSQDGINSSQLGFRGVEDLGGGLKAGFTLLGGVNAPTGTANGKFWNRRSTVSLFSNAGELRLGRDYQPTFWNTTIFDAFGTNGLGESNAARFLYPGVRSDNAVQYFLPANLGGFYGQAMIAPSEGGSTNSGSGSDRVGFRYYGARLGFAAGPFDVAFAYATQRAGINTTIGATAAVQPGGLSTTILSGQSQKTYNLGGAYDFGFLKLLGYYNHESVPNAHENSFSLSTVIPMGQGEVHVGYDRAKLSAPTPIGSKTLDNIKATYQYNLSKRTAMYGTVARLANKDNTTNSLVGGSSITGLPTPGGNSKGFEIGVRHFF
jgi:predicted porin